MEVWQAESVQGPYRETYGVFSSQSRAQGVCQGVANEYFGAENTEPLQWAGNDEFCSASYHHPVDGMWLFQVTRRTVDGVVAS